MKIVAKTMGKVVIEITTKEIEESGFEYFWDKIRNKYKVEEFDVDSIGLSRDNDKVIFVELISKKTNESY